MDKSIQNSLTELIIKQAAVLYDTSFDSIKNIGGFENFVFEYLKKEQSYILRFVHSTHRTHEQVLGELEFIDYLDKNNCPVSTVIHSINDNLSEIIKIDEENYFIINVFTKAPGRTVRREDLTDDFYRMFGEEIGRLHFLTKSYKPLHRRIEWDKENFFNIGINKLPKNDEIIVKKYKILIKKLQKIEKNVDNFGLIHTDLHFGNMFISSGKLTFFDWDDSSYKHFISDLAIVIFYHFAFGNVSFEVTNNQSARILGLLIEGYQKQNTIDFTIFKYLNDFLMLRTIVLYLVIFDAGEEMIDSEWGKRYIDTYRQKIIDEVPFLDLNIVLKGIL